MGLLHVWPPSVERLTSTSTLVGTAGLPVSKMPNHEMIHTLCLGSKATEASLARAYGPGGVALSVVPGRKPCVKVVPPLIDVAKPMLEAPPLKKRPTWKAETIV